MYSKQGLTLFLVISNLCRWFSFFSSCAKSKFDSVVRLSSHPFQKPLKGLVKAFKGLKKAFKAP
jgi:hypothetical protein